MADLKIDNEKYNKTLEILKAEEQAFRYTTLKYNEGVVSQLDLLQKREALYANRKAEVNDKMNYFIDWIGLYKATAGQNI